jgi:hypothetical protein
VVFIRPLTGCMCVEGSPCLVSTSIIVAASGSPGRVLAQRLADRGDTVIIRSAVTDRRPLARSRLPA